MDASLTESIDTTTPQGVLIFHMFSALAEFERALIRERTRAEDLATAKKILRNRGSKLAIEQERHLRIGGAEKRQMRFKGILRA